MTAERRGIGAAVLLALALLLIFRDLWWSAPRAQVDNAMFVLGALPASIVLGSAGWLAWHRGLLARTSALPEEGVRTRAIAWLLAGASAVVFAWARAIGKLDLEFIALGFAGLALVGLCGTLSQLGKQVAPAAVLVLGVALPHPVESEIVWRLQLATARWANELLTLLGREFKRAGVILRDGDHTFQVIDTCSGLTGMLILLVVAAIVRELFALGRLRSAALFLITPLVSFGVNVLRVAYVAGSPDPEKLAGTGGDHTLQGVAVLMGGTAAIYALGFLLDRKRPVASISQVDPAPKTLSSRESNQRIEHKAIVAVGSLLTVLALISVGVPNGILAAQELTRPEPVEIPKRGFGWTSEEAPAELLFRGRFVSQFHRRYSRPAEQNPLAFMDVFIGQGIPTGDFATHGFSSKRFYPGPDWNLVRRERRRIWTFGRDVDVVVAAPTPNGEHAVLYVWKRNDRGLVIESLRSFVGWDRLRSKAAPLPMLVKLVAYAPHGGELSVDRAEQRLSRFLRDFGEAVQPLSE